MAVEKKIRDFGNALKRLQESVEIALMHKNDNTFAFFRDSSIQRFEFTLEIAWKSIKSFLLEHEGIECRSPKGCIREFFSAGYLDQRDVATLLVMIDDRNLATHTYHESLADEIFLHIQEYLPVLQNVFALIKEKTQ